ncbi:MAG: hypothetical protein WCT77_05595, partial [Bacteroidota bacterium]
MINYFIVLIILFIPYSLIAQNGIAFVSDRQERGNYDIYYMPDIAQPRNVIRLTTNAKIDNHPDIFWGVSSDPQTKMVWSSDKTGNFQLYLYTGNLLDPNLESNSLQITSGDFPHRHPHFSHDGKRIVFDAKCREVILRDTIIPSECSIPVKIIEKHRRFEALCVYNLITQELDTFDIADADANIPKIWPSKDEDSSSFKTWVGHPSFSPDNKRILFSAAKDPDGSDWEVYSVAFDTTSNSISDLKQHTFGTVYPANTNPIQMSGGAHYSHDGKNILYTSTRTPLGNSLLFRISSTAKNEPIHPINQLTFHNANDYVPEEMEDGKIILTTDLGPSICDPDENYGPSMDLDLVIHDLT